jgi:hypothetical protein
MKSIFQKMMKAPVKSRKERLHFVEPATLPGHAPTSHPFRTSGTGAEHTGRCLQNCFQKSDKPHPEVSWKKLESKFHFVR